MDSFPAKYGCCFFGQNRFHLNKVFASLFDFIKTSYPLRVSKAFCMFFCNVVMWPCCWLNWQSQSDTGHNSQFLPNVSSDKVTGPKILAILFSHLSSGSFIRTTNLKCWKSPSVPPSCISQREGVGRSVLDLRFKLDSMLTQPTCALLWEESSKKNTGIFHRHRQHMYLYSQILRMINWKCLSFEIFFRWFVKLISHRVSYVRCFTTSWFQSFVYKFCFCREFWCRE